MCKYALINLISRLPGHEWLHFMGQKLLGKHRLDAPEMLRRAITNRFEVTSAESLSDGLTQLDTSLVQLVLLDLSLPDSQGLATFRSVRKHINSVPIIVLSGLDDESLAVDALREGAQDYIVKGHADQRQLEKAIKYALERNSLFQKLEKANKTIECELDAAREVQQGLYPNDIPKIDGIDISASIHQAKQVGGDYYDIIRISNHEIALLIADVAGHDIASAFVVGMAKISFSSHIARDSSVADVMAHVNEDMLDVTGTDHFLTAFLAILDTHSGNLRYSSAGHFKQCIFRKNLGKLHLLAGKDMMLGAFEDATYHEQTCKLEVGDKVVLFTDGLFENKNAEDEQYGQERLYAQIQRHGQNSPCELQRLILEDQSSFSLGTEPNDDICLLVAELKESALVAQSRPVFGTERLTIPPISLHKKVSAAEGITTILMTMDSNNYPDQMIRQYKILLQSVSETFRLLGPSIVSPIM